MSKEKYATEDCQVDDSHPNVQPPEYDEATAYHADHEEDESTERTAMNRYDYPEQAAYGDNDQYVLSPQHGHHQSARNARHPPPHTVRYDIDQPSNSSYADNQYHQCVPPPPSNYTNRTSGQPGTYHIPHRPSPLNGPYNHGGIANYDQPSPYFNRDSSPCSPYMPRYNNPHHPENQYNQSQSKPKQPTETRTAVRYQETGGIYRTTVETRDTIPEDQMPRHYRAWSILNTICCCLLIGGCAVYMSNQTRASIRRGNLREAKENSKCTLILNIICPIAGIIASATYILLRLYVLDVGQTQTYNFG